MAYRKIALPADTPDSISALVRGPIDNLLSDAHAMFRLPVEEVPGLEAGCNLSLALLLLSVVTRRHG